jgi:hypothetical protein
MSSERLKRDYAAYWDWPDKNVKERGIMRAFLRSREGLGLSSYREVTAFKPDPPDFVARAKNDLLTAIELTELVSERAIKRNIETSKAEDTAYRDWTTDQVFAALKQLLINKDAKRLNGGPYDEVQLLIHTDEPVISPGVYIPYLQSQSFPLLKQITKAFLLFSYDPSTAGCPLVALRLE